MTWLYLPLAALPEPETHASSAFLSARAQAGSTSGSPSHSPDIVPWATSNGKPSPQPLSWRGGHRHCGLSVPAVLRCRQTPGCRRPAPPLSPCRPHHRRNQTALRLPRECRPSSPPRLPRSRQRTGRHGLQACGRPLHSGGSRRAAQARAPLHSRHPRGGRAGRPHAPALAPDRVAGTGRNCCASGRRRGPAPTRTGRRSRRLGRKQASTA